jgi:hypothetical protein
MKGKPETLETQVFAPSSGRRITSIVIAALVLGAVGISMSQEESLRDELWASVLLAALIAAYLIVRKHEILVDEEAIVERRPFKSTRIAWTEVDDLLCLENTTVIKSSRTRKKIAVFHASPNNIFHQLQALDRDEELRDLIAARSRNALQRVWNDRTEPKEYRYSAFSYPSALIALSPLLVPILAILVVGRGPIANSGTASLYLFFPFILLSAYVAFQLGLFASQPTIVVSDGGISLTDAHKLIPWQNITGFEEKPGVIGLGCCVIRCDDGQSISVPRSIERFCDLALRIKSKIGGKFTVELNMPQDFCH